MPKKAKWEDFVQTKEYKLWSRLKDMAEYLQISGDNYITTEDIGGVFWEPFFVILFKFGNMMKLTGKLKEIKMDWMRPLGYLGSQSDVHVKYDGRDFLLDKGAIGNASNLRFAFQHVLDSIVSFDKLDESNFQAQFKEFTKQARDYFKYLNVFVKDGFRPMHENLKDILGPLRGLRKSGYRLFNLEQLEAKNEDLTMFQNKKDLGRFTNNIKRFFQSEEYKLKRDCNIDDFDQFLGSATVQEYYSYKFNNKTRDDNSNHLTTSNSIKDENKKEKKQYTLEELQLIKEEEQRQSLMNININDLIQRQANRFHKDALQLKFEEGFDAMYKYLNDKEPHRFPFTIESHKMFVNITKIPNGLSDPVINYYLNQLVRLIEELKLKLFEMKLNGLSRVLIPITKNEDLTNHLKSIYDVHNIIDRVIGDYLLDDQYIFIHQCVQFILNSSLKEELEVLKRKEFMEDSLPKYVFFQSMRHSVKIMRNMITHSRNEGKYFDKTDYYQMTKHVIDGENNIAYYAYELTDSIKKFLSEASNETNKILQKEINAFGRFWLLEGFFPPKDRDLWLEAIEILNNINELVQEDMRDMLLLTHEKDKEKTKEEVRLDIKVSENGHKNSISQQPHQRRQSKLMKCNKPLVRMPSQQKRKRKMSSISEDENGMKIPTKLDNLRPPYVWNFPVLEIESKKRQSLLKEGKEQPKTEIRKVDPRKCYRDQRVEKFMSIFNTIVVNALEFCKQDKGNKWNYFLDMVLKVHHITYEKK